MKTRSQSDAMGAWNRLRARRAQLTGEAKEQYGGMAHHLPVLIQNCGLMQALAFVEARGKESHQWLLQDLAQVLGYNSAQAFVDEARAAELMEYIYLSTRATEVLLWFKRYAQSELEVDASADTQIEEVAT